ncbi:hypothetical protein CTI12_AA368500 [Artemisia annua]|uniref:Helitron helicase-like domain-containing protein n=1 Tax=Artemisia annua TaxID=35608 RepID=A0A2U1ML57_ARTAN|nr:hypothetical protein CTI12_AA368500 [Artemisia annua]
MLTSLPSETIPPPTNTEESATNVPSLHHNIMLAQMPGHTVSTDKQKNIVDEISNKFPLSTQPYCYPSFSEVPDTARLLCTQDLSMIDDNRQTIIPQHLKLNDQHLPLPSASEGIRLHNSANESESTAYQTHPHLTSHTCYTPSMDKGKSKIFEVSNKDQTFQQACASASFSESDTDVQLLCTENFSSMANSQHQITPGHLTYSSQHLPLPSHSHVAARSSNESKHCYYRKVQPVSSRNRGRGRPRKRSITSIQEPANAANISDSTQYLCQPGSSSNESAQAQFIPTNATNLNPSTSGLRRHRRGAVHSSSARNQRRGQPRDRDRPARQSPPDTYIHMGQCDRVCRHCKARFWYDERVTVSNRRWSEYHKCCNGGKVRLDTQPDFQKSVHGLRADIVANLIDVLDEHNELVQLFRTARNKMADANIPQFKVRLYGVVGSRQHELPTGDSIGAIVFEGGADVETDFDVVIERHDRRLQ